jgi:hypothetical protein
VALRTISDRELVEPLWLRPHLLRREVGSDRPRRAGGGGCREVSEGVTRRPRDAVPPIHGEQRQLRHLRVILAGAARRP